MTDDAIGTTPHQPTIRGGKAEGAAKRRERPDTDHETDYLDAQPGVESPVKVSTVRSEEERLQRSRRTQGASRSIGGSLRARAAGQGRQPQSMSARRRMQHRSSGESSGRPECWPSRTVPRRRHRPDSTGSGLRAPFGEAGLQVASSGSASRDEVSVGGPSGARDLLLQIPRDSVSRCAQTSGIWFAEIRNPTCLMRWYGEPLSTTEAAGGRSQHPEGET